ncbi:MAG: hypothetical protein SO095_03055 [Candidatus Onthovivens sp.]|nr:hypothetical protein [Candidatus Onthovivens sp.]
MQEELGFNEIIINLVDRKFDEIVPLYSSIKSKFFNKKVSFQIGSYTCSNYLKYICKWEKISDLYNLNYDLVLPIFPEHDLFILNTETFENLIENAKNIVVNDFGMLKKYYGKKSIRLGRMFFKDYRDHRYEEVNENLYISKFESILKVLKDMDININLIENDIISNKYKINAINNANLKVYFHFPYRQISSSHICEFASISKNIFDKFKPDSMCKMECINTKLIINDSKFNNKYLKIGRSIFDLISKDFYIKGLEKVNYIYTPRWE